MVIFSWDLKPSVYYFVVFLYLGYIIIFEMIKLVTAVTAVNTITAGMTTISFRGELARG
jgi:hypothetical protein